MFPFSQTKRVCGSETRERVRFLKHEGGGVTRELFSSFKPQPETVCVCGSHGVNDALGPPFPPVEMGGVFQVFPKMGGGVGVWRFVCVTTFVSKTNRGMIRKTAFHWC